MDRFERFLALIEVERQAEIEQNSLELARFPAEVREALGRSVTRLTVEEESGEAGLGGLRVLSFVRTPAGEDLSPFHAMSRGDLVSVETPDGRRIDGTLTDVEEYRALAAMSGKLPDPLPGGRWTLHRVGSDATYKRMRQALMDVRAAVKSPAARFRDIFDGKLKTGVEKTGSVSFLNRSLNAYQQEAVRIALAAKDAALIHGPPGTGKTTVLAEIVWQSVQGGQRVLASAPSNIAVDNLLEKLLAMGLRVVRLGHPARTLKSLQHATLSAQVADHPDRKKVRDLDLARERIMVQRSRRADRSQLSWTEKQERQRRVQSLWREARNLEKAIVQEILDGAQVVVSTHAGLSKAPSKGPFDLAVLDEASQATEPLSWIPLRHAKKVVLAGDPLQLPPTLYSAEAARGGLSITLFERLQAVLPERLQVLLRVQYRMNQDIMDFPSREFYGGKLVADKSVRGHLACGLPRVKKTGLTQAPLAFVDTAGAGFEEAWDEALQSRENMEEAALSAKILGNLIEAGLRPKEIALITPYVAQVKRLKALVREPDVEVGTVDGFQGREKEAVIISLVRSNSKGEVGFLKDGRRMNVAITRARRLLIVVGDSGTVTRHPLYARFVEYAGGLGAHRSAWEWIGVDEG